MSLFIYTFTSNQFLHFTNSRNTEYYTYLCKIHDIVRLPYYNNRSPYPLTTMHRRCPILPLQQFEALMAMNGRATIKPHGNSMLPFIHPEKDILLLVRLLKSDTVEVGDIVMARTVEGRIVIHRIFSATIVNGVSCNFVLMGDGNRLKKERCDRGEIIARVDRIIHPDGSMTDCNSTKFKLASYLWLIPMGTPNPPDFTKIYK